MYDTKGPFRPWHQNYKYCNYYSCYILAFPYLVLEVRGTSHRGVLEVQANSVGGQAPVLQDNTSMITCEEAVEPSACVIQVQLPVLFEGLLLDPSRCVGWGWGGLSAETKQ
eukprot:scaffold81575_cov15-Tisochrysis_lutea.AAC.1